MSNIDELAKVLEQGLGEPQTWNEIVEGMAARVAEMEGYTPLPKDDLLIGILSLAATSLAFGNVPREFVLATVAEFAYNLGRQYEREGQGGSDETT